MHIQTAARPAIAAILEIARINIDQPVSVTTIGKRIGVSVSYLEILFQKLLSAGVVGSTRGSKGGYSIVRPLDQITVGEVIKAVAQIEQASKSEMLGHELWEMVEDKVIEWCMNVTLEKIKRGKYL